MANVVARFEFEPETELQSHGYVSSATTPGLLYECPEISALSEQLAVRYEPLLLGNDSLPIHAYRDRIIDSVRDNAVTIIVAETGSGKSTQIAQYLHDDHRYDRIYLTQPRRVATRNVYERVRSEISEVLGDETGDSLTMYQTGGDREGEADAQIQVVTDGLQLVKELKQRQTSDRDVLVIDEVHEWNTNIELLVGYVKQALREKPNMRVAILSATLDAESIIEFFATHPTDHTNISVNKIEVPGRSYEVEQRLEPESTVVEQAIGVINEILETDGALDDPYNGVLIFEPGKREIGETINQIKRLVPNNLLDRLEIHPLHAKLSPTEQDKALTHYPGKIKIVVSTEVAQTSLTIPDIKYVISSGIKRTMFYESDGANALRLTPISIAEMSQQGGRTGRVGPGTHIITRPDSNSPFIPLYERDEYPTPEITRSPIDRSILRLKDFGSEIPDFETVHEIGNNILQLANVKLELLDAVDEDGSITEIGQRMNEYQLSTHLARIMVESERYNEKTRAMLAAITASREAGGLRFMGRNVEETWKELLSDNLESDMLAELEIFLAAVVMRNDQERRAKGLDINNYHRALETFHKIARTAGTNIDNLQRPSLKEIDDIKSCIYTGYLNNIYRVNDEGKYVHAFNDDFTTPREISKRSVITGLPEYVVGDPFNAEISTDKGYEELNLLENVTAVSIHDIATIAKRHTNWQTVDYKFRKGKLLAAQNRLIFGKIAVGGTREISAEPSQSVRRMIIEHAIANPGKAQQQLRRIKKELERLDNLTTGYVKQFTQKQLEEVIEQCAPDDITSPATIEDNIRLRMIDPENPLSLDSFISPEQREYITTNSPDAILIGDNSFPVDYRKGQPIIKIRRKSDLKIILENEEPYLDDGRQIRFMYSKFKGADSARGSRLYSKHELKDL